MAKCTATKSNGAGCKVDALPGQTVCWGHDPSKAEARKRIARKGGHAGGVGRPSPEAAELAEIKTLLKGLVANVYKEKTDRAIAITMNLLLNTQLRVIEIERKARETDELAARLAALEALQPQGGHRWGSNPA